MLADLKHKSSSNLTVIGIQNRLKNEKSLWKVKLQCNENKIKIRAQNECVWFLIERIYSYVTWYNHLTNENFNAK